MLSFKPYAHLSVWMHARLLRLRNSERVRSVSGTKAHISLRSHCEWLKTLDETKRYEAIFWNDRLIGAAHWVKAPQKEGGRWGFFFDPSAPPASVPLAVYGWLKRLEAMDAFPLRSEIHRQNLPARRLNDLFGVETVAIEGEYEKRELTLKRWQEQEAKLGHLKRMYDRASGEKSC